MKQIAVIFIFVILLVKAGGYNMILNHLQHRAYTQMVDRLDNNEYDEKDLIEVSAPLNLPYYTDWQEFERRDGQVTINGVVYNYVARKYTNNVMVYKCIPNRQHQEINDLKKEIDNITFNDADNTKGKKPVSSLFSSMSEYDDVLCAYHCGMFPVSINRRYTVQEADLCTAYADQPTPPPDCANRA